MSCFRRNKLKPMNTAQSSRGRKKADSRAQAASVGTEHVRYSGSKGSRRIHIYTHNHIDTWSL